MRSHDSDSCWPVFTLRDPITQEWIIRESIDEIVGTLQQWYTRIERYADDISLQLEIADVRVTTNTRHTDSTPISRSEGLSCQRVA